jgi:hypothetical protein
MAKRIIIMIMINSTSTPCILQYVKNNKKPVISFDEALRQVKDEMGME